VIVSATDTPDKGERGQRMGKPLKIVVVGDAHAAALRVAEDFERSGYEPAVFLAPSEEEFERLAPGCEMAVAWADATVIPPRRVLELSASRNGFPPVVIFADSYTEDEIVSLVGAGTRSRSTATARSSRRSPPSPTWRGPTTRAAGPTSAPSSRP
jgi:hypothetical protein